MTQEHDCNELYRMMDICGISKIKATNFVGLFIKEGHALVNRQWLEDMTSAILEIARKYEDKT